MKHRWVIGLCPAGRQLLCRDKRSSSCRRRRCELLAVLLIWLPGSWKVSLLLFCAPGMELKRFSGCWAARSVLLRNSQQESSRPCKRSAGRRLTGRQFVCLYCCVPGVKISSAESNNELHVNQTLLEQQHLFLSLLILQSVKWEGWSASWWLKLVLQPLENTARQTHANNEQQFSIKLICR